MAAETRSGPPRGGAAHLEPAPPKREASLILRQDAYRAARLLEDGPAPLRRYYSGQVRYRLQRLAPGPDRCPPNCEYCHGRQRGWGEETGTYWGAAG